MGFPRYDGTRWWSLAEVHDHLRTHAHATADRGWPVFPLGWFSKIPHIPAWPTAATCDHNQIHRWWQEAPYNIGIDVAGAGLVVLDLDDHHHGQLPQPWQHRGCRHGADVLAWQATHARQPDPLGGYAVATPTGSPPGQHRYFTAPDGPPVHNAVGDLHCGLGPGVDVRGVGGAITAAGSVRILRRRLSFYTVLRDGPLTPLPDWVRTALTPPPPPVPILLPRNGSATAVSFGEGALREAAHRIRCAPESRRAHTVFVNARWIGNRIAQGYLTETCAETELIAACAHLSAQPAHAPFPLAEALANLRRGLAIGIQEGHAVPRPA